MNPTAPAPTANNDPQPDSAPLKTDIVNNIPLHTGGAPAAPKPADELDKIMQDVGNELKKDDKKPHKRHLFGGKPKAPAPKQALNPSHPVQPHPMPATTHQTVAKSPPKPKNKSSAPVFVIFMTLTVAGVLIAAAMAAYK